MDVSKRYVVEQVEQFFGDSAFLDSKAVTLMLLTLTETIMIAESEVREADQCESLT